MKFLARALDRLSWPVLIAAGILLVALAAILSISVLRIDAPIPEIAKLAGLVRLNPKLAAPPEVPDSEQPSAAPASEQPSGSPAPEPPAAPVQEHPVVVPQTITGNLEARIRKRVHDELARVQQQLEQQQKEAMQEHEEKRLAAEEAIKEAQQEYSNKQRDSGLELRDAGKEYSDKQREIAAELAEKQSDIAAEIRDVQQADKDKSPESEQAQSDSGCRFEDGVLRCQLHSGADSSKRGQARGSAAKLRELERAQQDALKQAEAERRDAQKEFDNRRRDALKEFEARRREAHKSIRDTRSDAQRSLEDAQKEIAKEVAILGDSKTYKVPEIRIPEIKLPDLDLPAIRLPAPAPAPPSRKPPAPPAVAIAAPPAAAAAPPPPAPLSKDAMMLVERDVGGAVADTIGEEVHSALKGYRLALSGMVIGIALLLFSGAVIGKTVQTSNRAARARADLLRVEAERNLMNRQVVEAQLKMMQAQVEPHFLFNTLANVRFLLEADAAGAGNMLDHLIDYLHAALPQMRASSTTVGKETELARAYLEILRIRMGGRLDFAIHVPEALQGVSFPPMMLLSLVENAIKHGLEPMREGGRVDIEAALDGRVLRLAVKDTGVGLGAGASAEAGSGVGLANIRERLNTLYGEGARLVLSENQPRGMIAAIEIPYREANNGAAG